jgi:hypothetical protein
MGGSFSDHWGQLELCCVLLSTMIWGQLELWCSVLSTMIYRLDLLDNYYL